MNKEDLIYDKICSVEKMFIEEISSIKKDVQCLMDWRNKLLGAFVVISSAFWYIIEQLKK